MTLGINTASLQKSVCLFQDDKLLFEETWSTQASESKKILPAILKGLRKIKKNFKDIRHIVVCTGPGSFSSVRIGVTIANTLGFSLGIPLSPIHEKQTLKTMIQKPLVKKKIVTPRYGNLPSITPSKRHRI